jgi:hypothetical protein
MTRENHIHNDIDELMNTLDTIRLFGTFELEVLALQTISKPSCHETYHRSEQEYRTAKQ